VNVPPTDLPRLEAALSRSPTEQELDEVRRMLAELNRFLRAARDRAERALAAGGDLRPALRDYVRSYAAAHGRTAAEQVAAFAREGCGLFSDMFVLAVGFDPCA
jgi:hypothetical protein